MKVLQRGLWAKKHPALKPEDFAGTAHHPHDLEAERSQEEQSLYLAQVLPGSGVGGAGVGGGVGGAGVGFAQVMPEWSKGSHS